MEIFFVVDNDANQSVVIQRSGDQAVRDHCALFGVNQENCKYKAIGVAYGEEAVIILTS